MAFENLKSTGIKYLLNRLKTVFLQIRDAVKTVNGIYPDEYGDILVDSVPYAQNLETELAQRTVDTYISRTAGGSASISDGDAWLMSVLGNSIHTGYVPESIDMSVEPVNPDSDTAISATLNRDTFIQAAIISGTYVFNYTTEWDSNPATYGITVTGTPVDGDVITVVYVAEERGTISVANPNGLIVTGWNLFSYDSGYAKVMKYSDDPTECFGISGAYTAVKFSETLDGAQTALTVTDGRFSIPSDGYVWVTGGNNTNTAIWMTWDDWSEGYDGEFETYTQHEIDFSNEMATYFPNGLMKAGNVSDEINLNIGQAISRVERLGYSEANRAIAEASGRQYEFDEDYIYLERAEAVANSISVDGGITVDDHGMEFITQTDIPVEVEMLYGMNLKNKLERNVLTISRQSLTEAQKSQVRSSLGLGSASTYSAVNNLTTTASGYLLDARQGKTLKDAHDSFAYTQLENNTNLNNLKTQGFYASSSAASTQTMTGRPSALTSAFTMLVMKKSSSTTQIAFVGNAIYCRTSTSGGWGSWYSFTGTAVN